MEENQNNESINENAASNEQITEPVTDKTTTFNFSEEIKEDAKQSLNQVKDTIKNTDLKKDTKAAKGFFSAFFKNPIEMIKNAASDNKSNFFKMALITLGIWLVAIFICQILGIANRYLFGTFGSFSYFFRNLFKNFLIVIKSLLAPIIIIALLSVLVYAFKKNKNKSILTIVSTVTIAHIPTIIADIANILIVFSSDISRFISYFSSLCETLTSVLLFFAIKDLSGEDNKNHYFWKFALIMGIYYAVRFVITYFGIYI